jgi:hypothetical protein
MPQNGDINKTLGVYKSLCCGAEITIRAGAKFPECENHPEVTTVWQPIDVDKPADSSEKPDRRSA